MRPWPKNVGAKATTEAEEVTEDTDDKSSKYLHFRSETGDAIVYISAKTITSLSVGRSRPALGKGRYLEDLRRVSG